ncbi:MAG: hypothetical protein J6T53_03265 [Bacteroidales bacterium]|jgi:hypothetical protein|nr:hypothetical protein [Bacteroidales bacterium]
MLQTTIRKANNNLGKTSQTNEKLPNGCVPFSQFKEEYFRQLKNKYEEV